MFLNLRLKALSRGPTTILLGSDHLHHLTPPGQQSLQLPGAVIGQRPEVWFSGFAKVGQHLRVQSIRLGQLAHGFGKVSHLPGVHQYHRKLGAGQVSHQKRFQSSSGLQDHQGGSQLSQLHQQIGNPWSIIRDLPDLPAGTHANVQMGLGYTNPHVTVSSIYHIHLPYLLSGPALQDSGFLGPGNCSGSLGWGGATLLSHGFLNPG